MTHPRTTCRALAAALALILAGCQDPYQREPAPPRATPAAGVAGDAERPGARPPAVPAVPDTQARSALAAARRFARAWVNWDWRTLPAEQRALARLTTGRLADELHTNAKTTAADASLARDRPSSRGHVIAVALRASHRTAEAVLVTREQTYTAGHADLGGRHHRIYRARLTRGIDGWELRAWTPLP
jgi:hypothetical protein